MRTKRWLTVFSVASLAAVAFGQAAGPYHFLKAIPIGGSGGWDYLSVDPAAHRLYVSHATHIVVIDLNSDKIVGDIADTPGVHGIAIADDLGLGITSNGGANQADIVDLKTLRTIAKVRTAAGPDGMLYDPGQKEAWLFCGRAQAATVIKVKAAKVAATVPLGGRPEFATADPQAGRVYDNLENRSQVVVMDTRTHGILHRWPIAPGANASGMAIDRAHHRLFIGCRNRRMVMMDDLTGRVLAQVPIGWGVDACRFDPGTQLAFASCGQGTTTIARETGNHLTVVQTLKTEPGARTMALDPTTHNLYLVTAQFKPRPAAANGRRHRRPTVVPGTFRVLVYGMGKSDHPTGQ